MFLHMFEIDLIESIHLEFFLTLIDNLKYINLYFKIYLTHL
jgi:hypothetical protein